MWFDIPQTIAERNHLDYFTVSLKRKEVNYTVTYLMGSNHSPYVTGNDKYAMFIKWRDGDNIAVVVGQNPAVCKTIRRCRFHPDDTNFNIIKILSKMDYDGYIMVNTFSCIDTNGKQIKSIPQQNRNIAVAKDILGNKQISKAPIILACTNSNYIALDFIQFLNGYKERLYKIQGHVKKTSKTISIFHFSMQALNKRSYDFTKNASIIRLKSIKTKAVNSSNNSCLWDIQK